MKIKVLLFTVLVSFITINVPVFSQEECVEPEVLSPETFKMRRTRLLEKMNTGIALMKGSDVAMRNSNVSYEFRQESSFYYLTGFENSSAMLIIVKGNETIADKSMLFTSLKDEGDLDSPDFSTTTEVQKNTGIDEVYNRKDFDSRFSEIIKDLTIRYGKEQSEVRIYSDLFNEDATMLIKAQIPTIIIPNRINSSKTSIILEDLNPLIDALRLIKSPEEITYIETAIDITGQSIIEVMREVRLFQNERSIKTIIDFIYTMCGSVRAGFPSVIASGPETAIAHDDTFQRKLKDTDMIIIDIGAEIHYNTADITRSFPKNGKFSSQQRAIYEKVYFAQEEIIKMVKPGVTWFELHQISEELIGKGLKELGLITDETKKWQTLLWYAHSVGHKLGMDVHDVGGGRYFDGTYMPYKENMVVTVEPGIYINIEFLNKAKKRLQYMKDAYTKYNIPEFDFSLPTDEELKAFDAAVRENVVEYNEIGVRIEDDILVTRDGYRNLSLYIPKQIKDIEKLMLGAR